MSYTQQYAALVYPDRVRVLGVALKPVTIGHLLLLHRLKNPFVAGGRIELGHVLTALYVLSRGCKAAAEGLQRRRTAWLLRVWSWQAALRRKEAGEARRQIDRHIGGIERPPLWENDKATDCGSPFLLILETRLRHCLGASREEALNTPVSEALWHLGGHAEDQGAVKWVQPDLDAAIRELIGKAANAE